MVVEVNDVLYKGAAAGRDRCAVARIGCGRSAHLSHKEETVEQPTAYACLMAACAAASRAIGTRYGEQLT